MNPVPGRGRRWTRKITPPIPIFHNEINVPGDFRGGVTLARDFASWSNPDDWSQRRLSIGAPNLDDFRIQRSGDHFEIFRSRRFLSGLAARFGVAKVVVQ